jgi:hypothetical protein
MHRRPAGGREAYDAPAMIGRLPQAKGEVWEVGRRRPDIPIDEPERKGERPEPLESILSRRIVE